MTTEEFVKIALPAVLGAIGGYGAIRAELSAMRAQINYLTDSLAETRARMNGFIDSRNRD